MRIDKESKKLLKSAIANGICEKELNRWNNHETVETLCRKMKRGIDFCVKNDYPKLSTLKRFKGFTDSYGVFTDTKVNIKCEHLIYVLNGKCTGKVYVNEYDCVRLYIRHDCNITIEIEEGGICTIDKFDNAQVKIIKRKAKDGVLFKEN